MALKDPTVVPTYGSSEFGHGGPYNPMKLFASNPTGWTPYLVGHAGSLDLIQALYAGAQDLKGKKIILSLSAQWFSNNGIAQNTFAANFSALQAYKMLFNPSLTTQTKKDLAIRLIQFNDVKNNYPILDGLLKYYGGSRLIEALYWPVVKVEMASLEIQDA
jgi:D-alanine transfer protein